MIILTVEIKDREAREHFAGVANALHSINELSAEIGDYKVKNLGGRFNRMQSVWAEWRPSTIERKQWLASSGANVITDMKLFETGRMFDSLSSRVKKQNEVHFFGKRYGGGKTNPWHFHQYGTVKMRARPIFEHEKIDEKPIQDRMETHITKPSSIASSWQNIINKLD